MLKNKVKFISLHIQLKNLAVILIMFNKTFVHYFINKLS